MYFYLTDPQAPRQTSTEKLKTNDVDDGRNDYIDDYNNYNKSVNTLQLIS
jgi:hypothetical protein